MRKHIMDPTGINEEYFDVVCQETRTVFSTACLCLSYDWIMMWLLMFTGPARPKLGQK